MSLDLGFLCSYCGKEHDGLPFSYGAVAPAYWNEGLEGGAGSVLGDEQCVIGGEHFFIRARLILPIVDSESEFEWGVWVSLSESSFARATELWTSPERVQEPPHFSWLSTELPTYEPTTLNLKTKVHSQPVGVRPMVELEPTDHPLAVEQRTGITLTRVQAIAELLLHPQQ
ncbi:DUF2199 domain-containing protein [Nocardia sp. NBC_01009]|uniref:DUF2199 domain-containing protein n=1 Tax=Nocardia sp. NBC_01009 TaxID=2975996 RepID=UPI003864A508|nr:DUF2199 domain-containing protein [Nocardia sp. NBC_01009]